ncbi:MAG: FAD:protein FMN transferase [Clostridia bacterium]|nr:FAD:protein FMN transferase [Clostridia bacterium]
MTTPAPAKAGAAPRPRRRALFPSFRLGTPHARLVRAAAFFVLAALLLPLCGCWLDALRYRPFSVSEYDTFDTVVTLYGYETDESVFRTRADAAVARLTELHRMMDIYHEYDGMVNLATVNRLAGGEPVEVPRELFDLLALGYQIHEMTDGAVNVALGAVTRLWHECRLEAESDPEAARLPDPDALAEAARHCDITQMILDPDACTVTLTDPAMSLDVGALGKGWAADLLADTMTALGCAHYAINLGGNLRMIGKKPDGSDWTVGVQNPEGPDAEYLCRLALSSLSLSTSGSYQRCYTVDGVRYHHIIDPATGYPADHGYTSVSVLTFSAAMADALSTYLFLLSEEDGRALIDGMDGVEAYWAREDGTTFQSQNWPG